jgi:peroxiredoxin
MPHLVKVQENYGSQSFSIVGVTDVDEETAQRFANDQKLNFPILANGEAVREAYGVDLVWGSTFFLIGPDGTIEEQGLDASEVRLGIELGPSYGTR